MTTLTNHPIEKEEINDVNDEIPKEIETKSTHFAAIKNNETSSSDEDSSNLEEETKKINNRIKNVKVSKTQDQQNMTQIKEIQERPIFNSPIRGKYNWRYSTPTNMTTRLQEKRVTRSQTNQAMTNLTYEDLIDEIDQDELYDIGFLNIEEQINWMKFEHNEDNEISLITTQLTNVEEEYKEPTSYTDMLRRPESEKKKWLEAIEKEFENFWKRKVWRLVNTTDIPEGRTMIGSKWVWKYKPIKDKYRARLVALGYRQIPGVDYMENYSPVAGDMSLRLIKQWP